MSRLFFLVVLATLTACKPSGDAMKLSRTALPGKEVAQYRGGSFTDADLKTRLMEMSPYARVRYQADDSKKEYVEGLVRYELLVKEAVRQGLLNAPEVVDSTKRQLVSTLLKRELDDAALTVSREAIEAYYEKHRANYVKPAMTRLAHIFFAKEHRAAAEECLREALKLAPLDYAAFAKLARERSEDPKSAVIEGDLRFLSDEELSTQLGPALVTAHQSLTKVGSIHPSLVETDKGLHVVKLQARQPALDLSLEQASASIEQTLRNEQRNAKYDALLKSLWEKEGARIDEAALKGVEVDWKAPRAEPKLPPPGFAVPPDPTSGVSP